MTEALSKTLNHGKFDSVFQEVSQPELVNWTTTGELRLFHLLIRNNKINVEDLKKFLYMSIGDYVFSRAKIERFSQSGNRDAVIAQAQRALKKNGGADVHGLRPDGLRPDLQPGGQVALHVRREHRGAARVPRLGRRRQGLRRPALADARVDVRPHPRPVRGLSRDAGGRQGHAQERDPRQ